jgi:hypothetical protein
MPLESAGIDAGAVVQGNLKKTVVATAVTKGTQGGLGSRSDKGKGGGKQNACQEHSLQAKFVP